MKRITIEFPPLYLVSFVYLGVRMRKCERNEDRDPPVDSLTCATSSVCNLKTKSQTKLFSMDILDFLDL